MNYPNPCDKRCMSPYRCDCLCYEYWKEKFDKLSVDDTTKQEAYKVSAVISLKKEIEKHMLNISEEVKKEFML